MKKHRWTLALGASLLLVTCATLASFLGPEEARAEGVSWTEGPLDAALAQARNNGGRVFVKFEAEWCTYCRQLDAAVLSTADGAALTEGLVAVRIDFDAPESRELVERYVILGLPTVLVLTSEGSLAGRIDGYESPQQWLEEAREAVAANDPLPELREAYAAAPDDGAASFALGEGLLTRGYPEEGVDLLERTAFMNASHAANALFLLGRYHHRVQREPRIARHYWRELAMRFPGGEHEAGAYFWYARAEAELDHADRGLAVLEQHARANADDVHAVSLVASFLERYEVEGDRAGAAERLRALLGQVEDAEERAELETLCDGLAAP